MRRVLRWIPSAGTPFRGLGLALWLALCVALCPDDARAGPPVVAVVLSERSAPYVEALDALRVEWDRAGGGGDLVSVVLAGESTGAAAGAELTVALGSDACRQLIASNTSPLLCTLLPRIGFERILESAGRRPGPGLSALYLNQPLPRQLALIHLALPSAKRVGALVHPGPGIFRDPSIDAAAQSLGLRLVLEDVTPGEPVYAPLKRVLDDADVLLAIADPEIYNPASVQNILLASFRARIPIVAFSPAYARAGALLALYSTPTQIGQQAAQLLRTARATNTLGQPQYPNQFNVSINAQVAHSLDLHLDAGQLTERLRRLERAP